MDLFGEVHIPLTECGLSQRARVALGEKHSMDRVWADSKFVTFISRWLGGWGRGGWAAEKKRKWQGHLSLRQCLSRVQDTFRHLWKYLNFSFFKKKSNSEYMNNELSLDYICIYTNSHEIWFLFKWRKKPLRQKVPLTHLHMS